MSTKHFLIGLTAIVSIILISILGIKLVKKIPHNDKITFYHYDVENEDLYKHIVSSYMDNGGGLVEIKAVPYDEYLENWQNSYYADKSVDIFAIPYDDNLKLFTQSGEFTKLSKKDFSTEYVSDKVLDFGVFGKDQLAVPIKFSYPVVFYNKNDYSNNNLVASLTTSDFLYNCQVLKDSGKVALGFSVDEKGKYDIVNFAEGVMANGYHEGDSFEEARLDTNNGEGVSEILDIAGVAYQMQLGGYYIDKENAPKSHKELLEEFANGKYSMIVGTTDDISILNNLMNDAFDMFIVPGSGVTNSAVIKTEMMVGISDSSKNKSEAKAFIDYLLSENAQTTFSQTNYEYDFISFFQRLDNNDLETFKEKINALLTEEVGSVRSFVAQWDSGL